MRLANSKHGVTSYGSKDMSTSNFIIEKKSSLIYIENGQIIEQEKGKSVVRKVYYRFFKLKKTILGAEA